MYIYIYAHIVHLAVFGVAALMQTAQQVAGDVR